MAKITLKGNAVTTSGNLPEVGSAAKDFKLIASDLSVKTLSDYKGKTVILNIYPSVDTGTCATSTRKFNEMASDLDNTVVLCISKDLPFAFSRFCGAEGIDNVETLSDFRTGQFGKDYGVEILDGPLTGLLSRAIVVINPDGKIVHTEQVPEIVDEPNYDAALASV